MEQISHSIVVDQFRRIWGSVFVRNVAHTLVTRGLATVIGIVTSRILGPHGRGEYAAALVLATLCMQIGNLGLYSSNVYFTANRKYPLSSIFSTSVFVGVGVGGGIALALKVAFHLWPGWAPVEGSLLNLALIWIPLGLTFLLFHNILMGLQQPRVYNNIELANRGVTLIFILAFIYFAEPSPPLFILAGLLTMGLCLFYILFHIRSLLAFARPSLAFIKESFSFGLKVYLSSLFSVLVMRIDLLMVKHYLGDRDTGLYSIDAAAADFLFILPFAISGLLVAKLSGIPEAGTRWALAKKALIGNIVILGLVLIAATALIHPLILLVYGEAYRGSIQPFYYLAPGIFFMSIVIVLNGYCAASGMPRETVLPPIFATVVNIGLNIWLIPRYGIIGAAVASSLTYGLYLLFLVGALSMRLLPKRLG